MIQRQEMQLTSTQLCPAPHLLLQKDQVTFQDPKMRVLFSLVSQNYPELSMEHRGHRESEDSDNKGNFLAILHEIAKHDQFIEKRLEAYGNAKYTSHQIQNEILQGLAEMSSTLDLARAVELLGALTDTFQDYRNEKYFGELWKEVEELAEQCTIGVQTQYKRHPRISSRFLDSLVMSTVGQRNCDDEGFSRALSIR
ncbi:hypothetical protein SRHO_G00242510 [Serrasalmus rhombeus]